MIGIILTAAKAESSLTQIFGDVPTGIIPVNGKPIIFYIIENLIKNNISEIYIAVDYKKESLINIVDNFFSKKIKITYVDVDGEKKPGSSLLKVLQIVGSGSVLINLADTYIELNGELRKYEDFIFTVKEFSRPKLWCTANLDNERNVTSFIDKQENIGNAEVVTGIYKLNNIEIITKSYSNPGDIQISDLLTFYNQNKRIKAVLTNSWLDFGHIDRYQISKKRLLESRVFNSLKFDDTLGTILKTSKKTEKFVKEINWQLNIPNNLKILFPRIVEYNLETNSPFVKMEYYSYQTVAEIWLYSEFKDDVMKTIIDKLIKILSLFYNEKRKVDRENYINIYKKKTIERVDTLLKEQPVFNELFSYNDLEINNIHYKNWYHLCEQALSMSNGLYNENHNCLIHGDYCFSNILYDINSGVVRLIDPRGIWDECGNGDIKYDVAKLRHSVHGGYDFIVNDLFFLERNKNVINYHLFGYTKYNCTIDYFDNKISELFDLNQIKLIEGLLFLSMIPLHNNNLERQIIMFSRALELLNEVVI